MQTTLNIKFLVDTNILVYALDRTSPFYPIARQILEECIQGSRQGIIAQQNLVECANVLFRDLKKEHSEIMLNLNTIALRCNLIIITPLPTTYFTFLNLCYTLKQRKREMFDVFLSATMLDNGITHIITVNEKDFTGIKGISVYNPFKKDVK